MDTSSGQSLQAAVMRRILQPPQLSQLLQPRRQLWSIDLLTCYSAVIYDEHPDWSARLLQVSTVARLVWAFMSLIVGTGAATPQAPTWDRYMQDAEKAVEEKQYGRAEDFFRKATKEAEKSPGEGERLSRSLIR